MSLAEALIGAHGVGPALALAILSILGVLCLIAGTFTLYSGSHPAIRLSWWAAIGGIVMTVLAVEQASHGAWPIVIAATVGAIIALVAFGVRQRTAAVPICRNSLPASAAGTGAAGSAAADVAAQEQRSE